ncbi:extracellular solute-binding protein [Clostridium cadaveris]|uniref:extracellular solute-binding protein n=1 Tax=Clostridium cadaveris TaxID=1529 RepID=UPI000C06A966|nr:extracellular solute-binding protein [Clostridium cadaveris]NWK11188.1 extracellular solute-binding protein [Clostridium cadaveris]UFH64160.1 extracellular solute-binding protein [Clostridium cadaveris]
MKKLRIVSFLLAATMGLTLAGCGTSKKDETADKDAKLEENLVIYSTHPENLLQEVSDAFTEKTGVKVEFVNLKGELADRVRAEKENPQADIMFGGASSLFMEMTNEGLFQSTTPSWASELDPMFKDKDGAWYGTIKTPVMMFYNTSMLSKDKAPKDWSDLTKPEYKNLIVSRDTASSSIRSTLMALIYGYEKEGKIDDAWTYLKGLDANMKNYYNNDTMLFQAIGKDEAAIGFSVLSAITQNKDKNNMPLEVIDAKSGSVVITDGIAAIKNAPHPNAAKAFVEFAGSAEMQSKVANDFGRIPTLKSALKDSPEWMQTEYKAMDTDWSVVSKNQSQWLQKFDNEILDANKKVTKK